MKFVDHEHILEARSGKNTYWNKLVAIDGQGNLRNGIEHPQSFGQISQFQNTEDLLKFLESSGFMSIWNSSKEESETCNRCELRLACVDNRIPNWSEEKSLWVFDEECPYNPD